MKRVPIVRGILLAMTGWLALSLGYACAATSTKPGPGTGLTGGGGTAGAGGSVVDAGDGGGVDQDGACLQQTIEAEVVMKPMDVIFVMDGSATMADENQAVEDNINTNFAAIMKASGLDYRVIFLARHGGSNLEVCITAPLSATDCNPVPAKPANNPPIFFHYDIQYLIHDDLWCKVIEYYSVPDVDGITNGYQDWLRPEAFKTFVALTDGRVSCTDYDDGDEDIAMAYAAAQQFDSDLLALSPAQFGTAQERHYVWHSIVGLAPNVPDTAPWGPTEPIITERCVSAINPGIGYQALSNLTGGLKFPVCSHQGFDAIFQEIAEGVIKSAKLPCEYPVPDNPNIDPATIELSYTPSYGAPKKTFSPVDDLAACKPDAFYIEADTIKLCPESCVLVEDDPDGTVDIVYGCLLIPR